MSEACQNCKFFWYEKRWDDDELTDKSKGHCRLRPPVADHCYPAFPRTKGGSWCGEWDFGNPVFFKP